MGIKILEPRAGLEPATCRLRIGCSTTELPRHLAEIWVSLLLLLGEANSGSNMLIHRADSPHYDAKLLSLPFFYETLNSLDFNRTLTCAA